MPPKALIPLALSSVVLVACIEVTDSPNVVVSPDAVGNPGGAAGQPDGVESDQPAPVEPGLVIVSPPEGADVDRDFVWVEVDVEGFRLRSPGVGDPNLDEGYLRLRAQAGGGELEVLSGAPDLALLHVPDGQVTLIAELVHADGSPLEPPVADSVTVNASGVVPEMGLSSPGQGQVFYGIPAEVPIDVELNEFQLLGLDEAPMGPRQGRVQVVVDGLPVGLFDALPASIELDGAGTHVISAWLVDSDNEVWSPPITDLRVVQVAPAPTLEITTPVPGETIAGRFVEVAVDVEEFVLDGADEVSHGTLSVRLDGELVEEGLAASATIIPDVAYGAHELEVSLVTSDGTELATESVQFETEPLPPGIHILKPGLTAKEGEVSVVVAPQNFELTDDPDPGPGAGRWTLEVDGKVVNAALDSPQTSAFLDPGFHVITAILTESDGTPLDPPVTDSRSVEIIPLEPTLEVLNPDDGAVVPLTFPLTVQLVDFDLVTDTLDPVQPAIAGKGHFHLFVDGVYQGFKVTNTFDVKLITPGPHNVRVSLHYQNHQAVEPPVEVEIDVIGDDTPALQIVSPVGGADGGEPLGIGPHAVLVHADNFEIADVPDGPPTPGLGVWSLFVDGAFVGTFEEPATVLPELSEGEHTIRAELFDHAFEPVLDGEGEPVADEVSVTVDTTPRVRFASPQSGLLIAADDPLPVSVEVDNFDLVTPEGQPDAAGEGHFHLFLGGAYLNFFDTPRFELEADFQTGTNVLQVGLFTTNHQPVLGAAGDLVSFVVDDTPRVEILEPVAGSFTYGGNLEVILDPWNLAEDAVVQVWVNGILFYEGSGLVVPLPALAPGVHQVAARAVSEEGFVLGDTHAIEFEVVGLAPPLFEIAAPEPGAAVQAGDNVFIELAGFQLGTGASGVALPGEGMWTLEVDSMDTLLGPYTDIVGTLPPLPPGTSTLTARLIHADGTPVVPGGTVTRTVEAQIGPGLFVDSPRDGQVWYGPYVPLKVLVSGLPLGQGKGWLSVRIDGEPNLIVSGDRGRLTGLGPGIHQLELQLLDDALEPFDPPLTAEMKLKIGGEEVPTLSISKPAPGTVVDGPELDVEVNLGGIDLDPQSLGGKHEAGKGALHVSVDGLVRVVSAEPKIKLEGLSPGPHVIGVRLANLDGTLPQPPVEASVEIVVDPSGSEGP